MTNLLDRMTADWKAARIAAARGDTNAASSASLLGTLIGEAQTKQKRSDATREWTDADTLGIIKSALENARLTEEALAKTDRAADIDKAKAEQDILVGYMPQQLDEAEIETFVREKVASGLNKMGDLMAALKAEFAGQYDGKMASSVVKKVLS